MSIRHWKEVEDIILALPGVKELVDEAVRGMVAGGAVRDTLAGEEFTDVDIYVMPEDLDKVDSALRKAGWMSIGGGDSLFAIDKYVHVDHYYEIEIMVAEGEDYIDVFKIFDFRCNCVGVDLVTKSLVDVPSAVHDIERKHLKQVIPDVPEYRKQRMYRLGYVW